jgi:excisionase family DNA binding protein
MHADQPATLTSPRHQDNPDDVRAMFQALQTELADIRAVLSRKRKEHYTVEEIAGLVCRSEYTVRRWIAQKRIKAIRVQGTGPRGRLLIPNTELDVLIATAKGANVPDVVVR